MLTYHREIGFPEWLRLPTCLIRLSYTEHALNQARLDRYGDFEPFLPYFFQVTKENLVEATQNEFGEWVKYVCRISLTNIHDLVIVIKSDGVVKTVWINLNSDKHKTLNRDSYANPLSRKRGK